MPQNGCSELINSLPVSTHLAQTEVYRSKSSQRGASGPVNIQVEADVGSAVPQEGCVCVCVGVLGRGEVGAAAWALWLLTTGLEAVRAKPV